MSRAAVALLVLGALAGCATAYTRGQSALHSGRYVEAADHFQTALAEDPDRLDALIGLGVAQYKLANLDDAADTLGRAAARAPGDALTRLYLGLTHLRKGELGPVEQHLGAVPDLAGVPRLGEQVRRALELLRVEPVPSSELRGFVATSLEHELEWAQETQALRRALDAARRELLWRPREIIILRERR